MTHDTGATFQGLGGGAAAAPNGLTAAAFTSPGHRHVTLTPVRWKFSRFCSLPPSPKTLGFTIMERRVRSPPHAMWTSGVSQCSDGIRTTSSESSSPEASLRTPSSPGDLFCFHDKTEASCAPTDIRTPQGQAPGATDAAENCFFLSSCPRPKALHQTPQSANGMPRQCVAFSEDSAVPLSLELSSSAPAAGAGQESPPSRPGRVRLGSSSYAWNRGPLQRPLLARTRTVATPSCQTGLVPNAHDFVRVLRRPTTQAARQNTTKVLCGSSVPYCTSRAVPHSERNIALHPSQRHLECHSGTHGSDAITRKTPRPSTAFSSTRSEAAATGTVGLPPPHTSPSVGRHSASPYPVESPSARRPLPPLRVDSEAVCGDLELESRSYLESRRGSVQAPRPQNRLERPSSDVVPGKPPQSIAALGLAPVTSEPPDSRFLSLGRPKSLPRGSALPPQLKGTQDPGSGSGSQDPVSREARSIVCTDAAKAAAEKAKAAAAAAAAAAVAAALQAEETARPTTRSSLSLNGSKQTWPDAEPGAGLSQGMTNLLLTGEHRAMVGAGVGHIRRASVSLTLPRFGSPNKTSGAPQCRMQMQKACDGDGYVSRDADAGTRQQTRGGSTGDEGHAHRQEIECQLEQKSPTASPLEDAVNAFGPSPFSLPPAAARAPSFADTVTIEFSLNGADIENERRADARTEAPPAAQAPPLAADAGGRAQNLQNSYGGAEDDI